MKKVLKIGILPLVVFASILYGREVNQRKLHNALLLSNVEALAAPEYSTARCIGWGSVDCPLNHEKVEYVFIPYLLDW